MDSLRYWVNEMHVDGFRFDLAATLARELHDVDKLSSFFDLIQQDPVVSQVKLIAEPWDVGEGGYQVGNFPPLWSEWNGKYRDEVRDFWRGADHTVAEFGYRFTGSSRPVRVAPAARPSASINFITAHDGFTLDDLVSYNDKHNEANGEDNRDGTDDNRSWNCGVEGPTDDPEVLALRAPPAAQPAGHAAAVPGRADAARRRRDRPHPARQQQRLLPGQRDVLVRLGGRRRRPARASPGASPRCAATTPCSAGASGSRAGPIMRRAGRRHRVVHARRRHDDRGRLAGELRPVDRRVPQRRRHHRARARGASGWSTTASTPSSTPTRSRSTSCCPTASYAERWVVVLDTAPDDARRRLPGRAARAEGQRPPSPWPAGRSSCCSRWPRPERPATSWARARVARPRARWRDARPCGRPGAGRRSRRRSPPRRQPG